eukprot:7822897-Pyramimonas_sp.AAC.1
MRRATLRCGSFAAVSASASSRGTRLPWRAWTPSDRSSHPRTRPPPSGLGACPLASSRRASPAPRPPTASSPV